MDLSSHIERSETYQSHRERSRNMGIELGGAGRMGIIRANTYVNNTHYRQLSIFVLYINSILLLPVLRS